MFMREANLFCLFVFVFSKWINWGVIACDRKSLKDIE